MRNRRLGKISRLQQRCDKEFSKLIREKGKCERCRSRDNLDSAHVVTRKNLVLRWDILNVLCLCRDCHQFAHQHPKQFTFWFESTYPERVQYLVWAKWLYLKRNIEDYEKILEAIEKKDFESLSQLPRFYSLPD